MIAKRNNFYVIWRYTRGAEEWLVCSFETSTVVCRRPSLKSAQRLAAGLNAAFDAK